MRFVLTKNVESEPKVDLGVRVHLMMKQSSQSMTNKVFSSSMQLIWNLRKNIFAEAIKVLPKFIIFRALFLKFIRGRQAHPSLQYLYKNMAAAFGQHFMKILKKEFSNSIIQP